MVQTKCPSWFLSKVWQDSSAIMDWHVQEWSSFWKVLAVGAWYGDVIYHYYSLKVNWHGKIETRKWVSTRLSRLSQRKNSEPNTEMKDWMRQTLEPSFFLVSIFLVLTNHRSVIVTTDIWQVEDVLLVMWMRMDNILVPILPIFIQIMSQLLLVTSIVESFKSK